MFRTLPFLACALVAGAVSACDKAEVKDARGRELSVVEPADQTLRRGETNKVLIAITRDNFEDVVGVRFADLPAGVSVVEKDQSIARDANSATYTLHAGNDAALVEDHVASVTVSGPGGMNVSKTFKITVKPGKD